MSWAGDGGLDALRRFLEEMGARATSGAAPAAARAVGAVAAQQYASGSGPEGPWPPNKDGSVPLRGPTSEITFAARGPDVVATAPEVLRYHLERRPVFPRGAELPPSWEAAAEQAVRDAVDSAAPKDR